MGHIHPVTDTDNHFIIDPITRSVINAESKKRILMQNDHNSERFTFEIDRYVEGHDMLLCNKVELHYINTGATSREKNAGVYEITDFASCDNDETKAMFTWLISENATMYSGTLSFLVLFACIENGVATYRWHTGINTSISISRGMNNDDVIVEPLPDIIEGWRAKIFSTNFGYQAAVSNGFEGTEAEWADSLKGKDGKNGLSAYEIAVENGFEGTKQDWLLSLVGGSGIVVGDTEPATFPYSWFDTTTITSVENETVGILKVKDSDGNLSIVCPVSTIASVIGLQSILNTFRTEIESLVTSVSSLDTSIGNLENDINAITPSSIGAAELNTSNKVKAEQASSEISAKTDSYTLALTDAGKLVTMTSNSALTLTIPTNAMVAFPVGTEIEIAQLGSGSVTISASEGVTLQSLDSSVTTAGQYAVVCLKQIAADIWLIGGALE